MHILCTLLLIFISRPIFSDENITVLQNKEIPLFNHALTAGFGYKINRTLNDTVPLFFQYRFLFDNHWAFNSGLSFNNETGTVNGYYFDFACKNLTINGLDLGLKFTNYSYSLYGKGYNSIIPYFKIEHVFFLKLGIAFHFFNPYEEHINNIFYYAPVGFETAFYYSLGYHFRIIKNIYAIKIEINNHDRYYSGNNAYIGIMFKNNIQIQNRLIIFCDFEMRMSGAIALAANFYIFGMYAGITIRLDH